MPYRLDLSLKKNLMTLEKNGKLNVAYITKMELKEDLLKVAKSQNFFHFGSNLKKKAKSLSWASFL